MDEPTKKNKIVFGEATVSETNNPTTSIQKVVIRDEKLTLDGLMESWKFSPERKEQCLVMCANYVAGPENFGRCLDLMKYVAQNDSSKDIFPIMAPHLPAIFSLPAQEQEEILEVLKENIDGGKVFSAYRCVLETHKEAIQAWVYSGLDRLGLNQSELDHQYIWENLNTVFTQYNFLQNLPSEEQDESQELMRRLDFLEQIVPHYLSMLKLLSPQFIAEKPDEARAIARRIAVEYIRNDSFNDESTVENILNKVTTYVTTGTDLAKTSLEEELRYFNIPERKATDSAETRVAVPIDTLNKELHIVDEDSPKQSLPAQIRPSSRIKGMIIAAGGFMTGIVTEYCIVSNLSDSGDKNITSLQQKADDLQKKVDGQRKLFAEAEARNHNLDGQVKSLTEEKHDYGLLVKQLVKEKTEYQDLTEGYEKRIADGELISAEDLPASEMHIEYADRVIEMPELILGYLTPEEASGQLLDLEDYALKLNKVNISIMEEKQKLSEKVNSLNQSFDQSADTSRLQSDMLDESNRELEKENEELSGKVEFYETKDLCLQFRRLVEEKDKKGINTFSMRFAENYFGGCRTMSLGDFADKVCYLYASDTSHASIKKEAIKNLAATFEFDPHKPVKICP